MPCLNGLGENTLIIKYIPYLTIDGSKFVNVTIWVIDIRQSGGIQKIAQSHRRVSLIPKDTSHHIICRNQISCTAMVFIIPNYLGHKANRIHRHVWLIHSHSIKKQIIHPVSCGKTIRCRFILFKNLQGGIGQTIYQCLSLFQNKRFIGKRTRQQK